MLIKALKFWPIEVSRIFEIAKNIVTFKIKY